MIAIKEVDHNLQTVEKTRRGGNRNRMASVAPVQRLQHLSDGHKKHQRRNVTIALSGKASGSRTGGCLFTAAAASSCRSSAATAARRSSVVPRAVAAGPGKDGAIAVSGATGLIGTRLVQALLAEGYTVRVLTRNVAAARARLGSPPGLEYAPPPQWAAALRGATGVVNLAGEPIATRWTPEVKAEVKRSRVATTSQLAAAINSLPLGERPVFVSSSAVGFYGSSENATFNEESGSGRDYLAEVCREWEAAAHKVCQAALAGGRRVLASAWICLGITFCSGYVANEA